MRALLRTGAGRAAVAAVAALFVTSAAGLALLWPDDSPRANLVSGAGAKTQQAEVVESRTIDCRNPAARGCRRVTIELRSGPRAGGRSFLTIGDAGPAPDLGDGTQLRVVRNEIPPGRTGPGRTLTRSWRWTDAPRCCGWCSRSAHSWLSSGGCAARWRSWGSARAS